SHSERARWQYAANRGSRDVSEPAAMVLPLLARELADASGIASWVGGVGLGVCAAGQEVYETPAAAVMTAALPADRFRLFGATDDPPADLPRRHANWIEAVSPTLALVHGDALFDNLLRATLHP